MDCFFFSADVYEEEYPQENQTRRCLNSPEFQTGGRKI